LIGLHRRQTAHHRVRDAAQNTERVDVVVPDATSLRTQATIANMTVNDWLKAAIADAEKRGLPELKPLLEGLATSTQALRDASLSGRP
jgi:hypothetical protein